MWIHYYLAALSKDYGHKSDPVIIKESFGLNSELHSVSRENRNIP